MKTKLGQRVTVRIPPKFARSLTDDNGPRLPRSIHGMVVKARHNIPRDDSPYGNVEVIYLRDSATGDTYMFPEEWCEPTQLPRRSYPYCEEEPV